MCSRLITKKSPPLPPGIWFPAKRYGWGWGLPCRWQGWVVMAVYLGLLGSGAWVFPPDRHPLVFVAGVFILTAILLIVSWWKGEPPRWRWGGR